MRLFQVVILFLLVTLPFAAAMANEIVARSLPGPAGAAALPSLPASPASPRAG